MSDFETRDGTKIEPEEAEGLDRAKMGVGRPTPGEPDVEGQWRYKARVYCPWCWAANYCWLDSHIYLWFRCWYCGGSFRA